MPVGRVAQSVQRLSYGLDGPGIDSRWGARFSARPDRPWGPPSLLYNRYRVFPGGKVRPERAADHSSPSSAEVLEEQSYTSSALWATTGPVTGLLYLTRYYAHFHLYISSSLFPSQKHVDGCMSYCDVFYRIKRRTVKHMIVVFYNKTGNVRIT